MCPFFAALFFQSIAASAGRLSSASDGLGDYPSYAAYIRGKIDKLKAASYIAFAVSPMDSAAGVRGCLLGGCVSALALVRTVDPGLRSVVAHSRT